MCDVKGSSKSISYLLNVLFMLLYDFPWLGNAVDEMVSAVGADNPTHLVLLERKRGIFKGLLHHAGPKESQVAVVLEGTAIGSLLGVLGKGFDDALLLDLGLVFFQLGHGSLGTERDLGAGAARHRVAALWRWEARGVESSSHPTYCLYLQEIEFTHLPVRLMSKCAARTWSGMAKM